EKIKVAVDIHSGKIRFQFPYIEKGTRFLGTAVISALLEMGFVIGVQTRNNCEVRPAAGSPAKRSQQLHQLVAHDGIFHTDLQVRSETNRFGRYNRRESQL